MKEKIKLLKGFVDVLNSESMRQRINSKQSFEEQEKLIGNALKYLIASRNIDGLENYLDKYALPFGYYDDVKKYLRDNNGCWVSDKRIEERLFENVLYDGFLYHGTNLSNEDGILNDGLLSMRERLGTSFENDLDEVNNLFADILKRNGKYPIKAANIYNSKLDKVYLTPFIDEGLFYSSTSNELMKVYVRNLIEYFNGDSRNIPYESVSSIESLIIKTMRESNMVYDKNAENVFINFLRKYYPRQGLINLTDSRTLVFVPTSKEIVGHDFKEIFSDVDDLDIALYSFHFGELACSKKISPENLAILEIIKDKELVLKTK